MKKIYISRLVIKNFGSYYEADISFPRPPGLRLVTGSNLLEPHLGGNGNGKSTLFKAILFCLYGGRINSVLSWGQESLKVIVELQIDNSIHVICRFGPPMRLELDGKPATQEEIDAILGLSKNRFLHSVLFCQAAQLFPDLSQSERGELLDSVLNLSIWQRCAETASTKYKFFETELNRKITDLSYLEGRLSGLQTENDLQNKIEFIISKIKEWEDDNNQAINDLLVKKESWSTVQIENAEHKTSEIDRLEREIQAIRQRDIPAAKTDNEHELFLQVEAIETEITDIHSFVSVAAEKQAEAEKDEKFWQTSVCPACKRNITKEEKDRKLSDITTQMHDLGLDVSKADKRFTKIKKELEHKRALLQKVLNAETREAEQRRAAMREETKIRSHVDALRRDIDQILKGVEAGDDPYSDQISTLRGKVNPFFFQLEEQENLSKTIQKERKELLDKKLKLDEELVKIKADTVAVEYWKYGFKHIRLFFVEQILAVLQIEIQSAINTLGLSGWQLQLKTETETKSGTTKLGVNISVISPQSKEALELSSFSGGESQRLRLGIALGLGGLIQRSAGVKYDMLVMDEPTSWLSSEGIEDLLECFKNYSSANDTSVFIIDHRALSASSFDSIWTVTKTEKGSNVSC